MLLIVIASNYTIWENTASAQEQWTIRPEMRLPPLATKALAGTKTVAHFDFEKRLDGWQTRHPQVKVEHIKIAGNTGGRKAGQGGMAVRGREPDGWNFAISPRIAVEPGKKYRALMWIWVESLPPDSRPLYFKIQMVSDDGKASPQVPSTRVAPNRVRQWVQLFAEFEVPAGCTTVVAALEKGTNFPTAIDALVDEFIIEEITESFVEPLLTKGALVGPITTTANVHPRLYLTAARLGVLRASINTDSRWKSARANTLWIADMGLRTGPPDYDREMEKLKGKAVLAADEQLWQRPVGNMIPHLAMAYLLSGDRKYLDGARQWITASLGYKTWGLGRADGLDLAAGHQLSGIGLAYDWLYHDLTPEERATIRSGLQQRAGRMARAALTGRVWWHDRYMQNHLWVNCAGLATAGFALYGEVDEAPGWIRLAHEKFLNSLDIIGDDGASHEGYGYWEYGIENILRYTELAHDLLGIDLYRSGTVEHPWLQQAPLYALHLALPHGTWTRSQSITDLADSPRTHWYGPSYLVRNIARRYPTSPYAGVAQWLAERNEAAITEATSNSGYLNFGWYDPAIPASPPTNLPALHHFTDLGIVAARSGWTGNDTLLVVKCGPPLGHKNVNALYDYGAGHVHPDNGHFTFFAAGQFLFRDDGYSYKKLTGDHNTLLIDGKGQKGEGQTWFDPAGINSEPVRGVPRILAANSTPTLDTIVCDVAPSYLAASGLTKFVRTFNFHKPSRLEVSDEMEAARPVMFEARYHVEGKLEKIAENRFHLTKEKVSVLIDVDAPGMNVTVRDDKVGSILSLTSVEKQIKTGFKVVINVEAQN